MDQRVIERMEEIRKEVRNTPRPKLGPHSLEDWDDLAQARSDWNWWRYKIREEWDKICEDNGINEELEFIIY